MINEQSGGYYPNEKKLQNTTLMTRLDKLSTSNLRGLERTATNQQAKREIQAELEKRQK